MYSIDRLHQDGFRSGPRVEQASYARSSDLPTQNSSNGCSNFHPESITSYLDPRAVRSPSIGFLYFRIAFPSYRNITGLPFQQEADVGYPPDITRLWLG